MTGTLIRVTGTLIRVTGTLLPITKERRLWSPGQSLEQHATCNVQHKACVQIERAMAQNLLRVACCVMDDPLHAACCLLIDTDCASQVEAAADIMTDSVVKDERGGKLAQGGESPANVTAHSPQPSPCKSASCTMQGTPRVPQRVACHVLCEHAGMVASHARHFATGGRTGERLMALVEKGKAELMKPDAKLDVSNPLAMFGTEAERCAVAPVDHSD